jgi:hypothetical protein
MTTNLAASVLARLLNLAKQRGDDYNLLVNRFALERLLCRVASSAHADRFMLKGALLFSIWYDQPHRPTRDADLLGFGTDDAETLIATFRDIAAIELDDGIVFDSASIRVDESREDNRYGGLRVRLTGRIGNARCALQVDVGSSRRCNSRERHRRDLRPPLHSPAHRSPRGVAPHVQRRQGEAAPMAGVRQEGPPDRRNAAGDSHAAPRVAVAGDAGRGQRQQRHRRMASCKKAVALKARCASSCAMFCDRRARLISSVVNLECRPVKQALDLARGSAWASMENFPHRHQPSRR